MKLICSSCEGSFDKGLLFERSFDVDGYVGSDHVCDLDHEPSISGHIFALCAGAISQKVSLRPVVALSTAKAKYMAVTEGVK